MIDYLYCAYRPFTSLWWKHWFSPVRYYRHFLYKLQRANRGWADCDTWSLDDYLSSWLPAALAHLRDIGHGHPCDMGEKEWYGILTKMIDGFEAYNRLAEDPCSYEKEVGYEYPSGKFVDHKYESHPDHEKWAADAKPFLERDQKLYEEGMALFVKHFRSLWD